jgi:hypothetical protein
VDQVLIGENEDGYEAGDLVPLPGASAIARVNDLFLLGSHFLICGDATDPAVVRLLMRTDVARMVLTDEPLNVAIGGHVTGGDHREFVMASGELTDSEFLNFNQRWMHAVLPHLVDGGILGTFIDWRGLPIVHNAATGHLFENGGGSKTGGCLQHRHDLGVKNISERIGPPASSWSLLRRKLRILLD